MEQSVNAAYKKKKKKKKIYMEQLTDVVCYSESAEKLVEDAYLD